MTMQHWQQRITLGGAAVVAGATAVETVSSLFGKRDRAHIAETYRPESNRVMIYFPALATNAVNSSAKFIHLLESDSSLLVDYPETGLNRTVTFSELERKLHKYAGKDLLIYAVSMGSVVALDFRRYMLSNERLRRQFPRVRFILHSPVTEAADVNWNLRLVSYLGFIFRGGLMTQLVGQSLLEGLLMLAQSKHWGSPWFLDKTQQLKAELEEFPVRLIASELRAVHYGRRARKGEFPDSAVIVFGALEDVVNKKGPERLVQAFSSAQILGSDFVGHADIDQAVSSGGFAKILQLCM
ncbi:MAG: hypothetical protein NVSMB39_1540 [Candidatus Saccharimonadales bacterium]